MKTRVKKLHEYKSSASKQIDSAAGWLSDMKRKFTEVLIKKTKRKTLALWEIKKREMCGFRLFSTLHLSFYFLLSIIAMPKAVTLKNGQIYIQPL